MSDRLPGSSYDNPIKYRGYRIYLADADAQAFGGFQYEFTHEDYDGAPDANDSRHGHARTLEEARAAIDDDTCDRCELSDELCDCEPLCPDCIGTGIGRGDPNTSKCQQCKGKGYVVAEDFDA